MYAVAQDDKSGVEIEVPTGMELRKIGPVNVVVPKGTEVRDEGGVIFLENTAQYMSRKFTEMENLFNKLQAGQEKLKEELEQLIEIVDRIQQESLIPEEKEVTVEE